MPQKWRDESAKRHISAPTVALYPANFRPRVLERDGFACQAGPQSPVPPPELGRGEARLLE
eukprot:1224846-Ditylum_brightwellii.AAC.1